MKIRANSASSSEDSVIITTAIIPATVCGKAGNFIAEYNHDVLHSTKGYIRGLEFYQAIADKLDRIVNKPEVSKINGYPVLERADIGNWSEMDINHFINTEQFQATFNLGYEQNTGIELNPVGVHITFTFTE